MKVSEIGAEEPVPDGYWDAGFAKKPFAVANVSVSLFFLILEPFLD